MEGLHRLGHRVDLLGSPKSQNPFGDVFHSSAFQAKDFEAYDVIHFHQQPDPTLLEKLKTPYVVTVHGNANPGQSLNINSIFVSKNHAQRHHSTAYVYNGLNWSNYPQPQFGLSKDVHFLGNAAWKVKNLRGAVDLVKALPEVRLEVIGGRRFSWKMGIHFYATRRVRFHGMIGDTEKSAILNASSALLFPVRWHEPFGLSIIESMYYGCPVFGTPYGSLPELVTRETGALNTSKIALLESIKHRHEYDSKRIHGYARELFNAEGMTKKYMEYYERVMNGECINAKKPHNAEPNKELLPWR